MRILSNIPSLQAQRNLQATTRAISRALRHLSSGSRLLNAADDAAGMAFSLRLESQQRGMTQSIRNMNEGMAMLNGADQSLSGLLEITQRMRELALQASSGTLSSEDRVGLNREFQSLLAEYSRVAASTEFNARPLLDGSSADFSLQVGPNKDNTIQFGIESALAGSIFQEEIGDGSFELDITYSADASAASFSSQVVDLDGDGFNDILKREGANVIIRWGKGDGTWSSVTTLSTSSGTNAANRPVIADVDGDADLDVIIKNGTTLSTFINNGGKSFDTASIDTTIAGTSAFGFSAGDINGDGVTDLAVGYTSGLNSYIGTYVGDGTGEFSLASSVLSGTNTASPFGLLADFDGDGDLDALTNSGAAGQAKLAFNDGTGVLTMSSTTIVMPSAGAFALDMQIADIDGDGDVDIAVRQTTTIGIMLNNGVGIMTTFATYGSAGTPYFSLGDIDSDGYVDLAVASSTLNTIDVLRNSGTGLHPWARLNTSTTPAGLNFGDLNGDGVLDLLADHSGADLFQFWKGASTFRAADLSELHLLSPSNAQGLLEILDKAIANIGERKANIGAQINRLDYAQSEALSQNENLLNSKSYLMDVDLVEVTAEFTRQQILQQAQISVLAQANLNLQVVLGLFKNL